MKYILCLFAFTSAFVQLQAQEEIVDLSLVFVLEESDSELKKVAFQLPFAAGRRTGNEPQTIKHYMFQLSDGSNSKDETQSIHVKSVRTYEFGETLAANEIGFLVSHFDADQKKLGLIKAGVKTDEVYASFPSYESNIVGDLNLVVNATMTLPEKFVRATGGQVSELTKGVYKIMMNELPL